MIFNGSGGGLPQDHKSLLRAAKVWENSDSSTAFAEQTVELTADTGALFYVVELRLKNSDGGSWRSDIVFPGRSAPLGGNYFDESKFVMCTRNIVITGTSAVIGEGTRDGEANDEYVIPASIYAFYQ